MSTFSCPECGHRSEYDEWAGAARCPQCGFEPPVGEEMGLSLSQQSRSSETSERQKPSVGDKRSGLTRFLPQSGRTFITGLAWGLLTFALLMFISSWLAWSSSLARCLGITLPVLTIFVVWRLAARRESSAGK